MVSHDASADLINWSDRRDATLGRDRSEITVSTAVNVVIGETHEQAWAEWAAFLLERGIPSRMVWTGNVTRQPAFANVPHRVPEGGLPNADRVMEQGLILPLNHGLDDDDIEYLCITEIGRAHV